MKYFSEKLNKVFDDVESLEKEECLLEEKNKRKAEIAAIKKAREQEVEEAFKKTLEARKQAKDLIKQADEEYENLKSKFITDYGYFHMSFNDADGKQVITVNDLIEDFFGNFPFNW